jgi:hypothetical protein
VIGLSPSLVGAVQLTSADVEAGRARRPAGAVGTTAACGVTALDCADAAPAPLALTACTVNVYVVPLVSPVTVVLVAGGDPLTIVGE